MHAADAAGGKDRDPGKPRAEHCCGDRGGAGAAGGQADRKVGAGQLCHALRLTQRPKLRLGQADVDLAVQHRDGGRHGAMGAHLGLDPGGGGYVLRIGHPMGDDRAFQRHDGGTAGPGLGDLGRKGQGQDHDPIAPET